MHEDERTTIRVQHPFIQYATTKILVLVISSFGLSCAQAQPLVKLSAPEDAFIQDISIEVLKQAYHKIGYQIQIHRLPNVRSLMSANIGTFDGEVSRIGNVNANYPNLSAVPTAVNKINVIALGTNDSEEISQIKEVGNDVVCVQGIRIVEKLVRANKIECRLVVNINQALSMVALNRVKYTLLPETNAMKALLVQSADNIKVVSRVLHSEKLYHYLHKAKLDLMEPLDQALREMQTNGDIDEIRIRFLEQKLSASQLKAESKQK